MKTKKAHSRASILLLAFGLLAPGAAGAQAAMFGGGPSRNMVSEETGLPGHWNPQTGENVKWVAALGSQSFGGPIVADGKVFVGTNNEGRRNPKVVGDRGVLMAFSAEDGRFLWQAVHPKLSAGRVHDWPLQGICSSPAVEGQRLYYLSNRAEVVAADTAGFLDGENDGAIQDEADQGGSDVDLVWKVDLIRDLGVFPHNMAAGSPLLVGDALYTVTANGVDEGHVNIPAPDAPSFVALDKRTGAVLWQSSLPSGRLLHGQWSNPAYGVIAGRAQVIFPGGDGWLYSFDPASGRLLWQFDCNPKDSVYRIGSSATRNNLIGTPVIWDDKVFIGVGEDPEHGEGVGHLWAIDATMSGDVTGKAAVWTRGGEEFHRTLSTVAVSRGIVYAADLSGFLYALDAKSGKLHWTFETKAAIWGSPFVADGKVYLGNEDGNVFVLREGEKLDLLFEVNMGGPVYTTPAAKDGVLYVSSRSKLWALAERKPAAAPAPRPKGAEEGAAWRY